MRKLKKIIIFLLILVITYNISARFLLPLLKTKTLTYLDNYFKTETSLEKIDISLLHRRITLKHFSVKNTAGFGRGNLFEAKEITIHPKILSFIKKEPAISVTLTEPTLGLHRLVSGKTNWDFFWAKKQSNKNTKPFIFNELLIKNGIFRYSKEYTSNKIAAAAIQGLFIYLKRSLVPITYIETVPLNSRIKGRGYLPTNPKGILYFTGEINLEQKNLSFLLDINMENIPLIYFNDFYPENSQIKVIQGNVYIESGARCVENNLYAKPIVTVKNLKLKLTSNYSTGRVFELPVALVVDFFDLYKEELKFSFEIKGTLQDPQFQLGNITAKKVSEVIAESIAHSVATSPALAAKLGKKIKNIPEILQKLGISIGENLQKAGTTAISPAKEFIKGIKGKK